MDDFRIENGCPLQVNDVGFVGSSLALGIILQRSSLTYGSERVSPPKDQEAENDSLRGQRLNRKTRKKLTFLYSTPYKVVPLVRTKSRFILSDLLPAFGIEVGIILRSEEVGDSGERGRM